MSGPLELPSARAAARVWLTRGHREYAVGIRVALGDGHSRMLLTDLRRLPRGRYTLTTRSRHGRWWVIARRSVTLA